MRILLSACPLYGHVNPVLALAVAAREAGHDVVVATGPELVPHVARAGVEAWAVGSVPPPAAVAGAEPDWLAWFVTSARERAADLVPRAARWRPGLVVAEETDLAGMVAATAGGARLAVHGLGIMPAPAVLDACVAAVADLHRQWALPFDSGAFRAATYLEVWPAAMRPAGARPWPGATPLRPAVAGDPTAGRRTASGGWLSRALDGLPYADTVHLTLGTVFHGDRPVLAAALDGLRELPVNVVVAVGPGADPASLGEQPAHVLVAPYLPYPELLPRCRAVVSQGGAGVLLAGLAHGLPQLAVPLGADQARNAAACRDAGAGLVLEPPEVAAESLAGAVAGAVARLLGEASFAASAREVAAALAAMPAAGPVVAELARQADSVAARR